MVGSKGRREAESKDGSKSAEGPSFMAAGNNKKLIIKADTLRAA